MPLILPDGLPAAEHLPLSSSSTAELTIGLINLMPIKPDAERDILSLLAPAACTVKIDLLAPLSHPSKNTPQAHIDRFYSDMSAAMNGSYDALILTGAPVEHLPFESVDYWHQLTELFDYACANHLPMLNICWGAFAALYHLHGVAMHYLERKISGIYPQRKRAAHPLTRGLPESFNMPNSRHAAWQSEEVALHPSLSVLADSADSGIGLIHDGLHTYLCAHPEYSLMTLDAEYRRDLAKGINPHIPANYYPADDPANPPVDTWHSHALLLYSNWIEIILQKNRQNCCTIQTQ
ncbi:MAG: homoserine O-succinyltransferase [Bacteroidales bacterium]|nr:homoserine O-succinyltransferase [Bacteroidales bacterium]